MMDDNIEIWDVDPDPELNSLFQNLSNFGTDYNNTAQPLGTDMLFLTESGVRSLGSREGFANFEDTSLGSPIDDVVVAAIAESEHQPVSTLYTTNGQYWVAIGNRIFVWTWSRNGKVKAWAEFETTSPVRYFTQLRGNLYMRTENDNILVVSKNRFTDFSGDYEVDIGFLYQSLKSIGVMKQMLGFDLVMKGEAEVSFGFDSRTVTDESPAIKVTGNTRPGQMNPMEIIATEISPRIRYTGPNDLRIDALSIYFTKLGLM
jgi:hypothetical protein